MTNQELLKVYSSYLPYGVKVVFDGEELEHSLVGLDITSTPLKLISFYGDYGQASFEFSKLVLRPLSDLAKGDTFKHLYILIGGGYKNYAAFKDSQLDNYLYTPPEMWSYMAFELFLSLHIDVFGLIDKNLAINLNQIEK